ncbi:PQQ-binding-like beta-propeller repeat protein [Pseudohalioglobus sediminis]|uniref:PQQ-binding-like beta-propeller repeat protein n=1 Tax=Pseudohalioglobus sediminis TaxID=2606449 RepID=A0A5B0WQK0_9GAMM|nr:PQQ-binding-like beta-propeller repeat protein [Pseudohalioglobus sediminis]KAA1189163.1 PQQ-binding-like beta-propeller repeat protein [Pseudohalioglobus sediminis]
MKKVLLVLLLLVLGAGAWLALQESPMKTLEGIALQHSDKLPLAFFGERLFDEHCASCHDNPQMHAPTRQALSGFSLDSVMVALTFGKMQPMAAHLSKIEKGLISIYLTGSDSGQYEWLADSTCSAPPADTTTGYVRNWGLDAANSRFVAPAQSNITRDNVGTLELAWALAFPKVTDMRSQPAILGDTLYFGDKTGRLYAIDRKQGCIQAHTKVASGIRSAITVAEDGSGEPLLVFADSMAFVYAVDPVTLDIQWKADVRLFDTSTITGSVSYHAGRLYVPVSSYEVAAAGNPQHVCCKSHGGVIALDAGDGDRLWEWHATADATEQGVDRDGKPMFGPSGVSVWSTPTIDAGRNRLYVGTGENLSHPATDTSDAVIALDLDTGEQIWSYQATANDVWNAACLSGGANCPENAGGDFDIGASVIHAQLQDGSELLLVGQKSGDAMALDMDGKLLWKARVSNAAIGPDLHQTTTNGGIHWGMALAGETLLVPAADPERRRPGYDPRPGIHALHARSGEVLWFQGVERGCYLADEDKPLVGLQNMREGKDRPLEEQYACSFFYGLSAAATATREVVFSGALNGILRAYDVATGELLWQTETARPFATVNGVEGHGGAIDVDGQVLAGDWLYVQSGYSMFGQLPGNVLLAYRLKQ